MIQVELTPNPNSLKFVSDRKLSEMSGEEFKKNNLQKIKNTTIKDLLEIEGVEQIYISDNFLTVNKKADSNWEVLKPMVIANINHHLEKDKGPIIKSTRGVNTSKTEEDTKIVSDIKEVLNTKIKPAVARDGGDIQFLSFTDGVVKVLLRGSCSGCPSSIITLKQGVQNILCHYIKEVKSVEAINE